MKVWGFDPSSNCGVAIWDTTRSLAGAHCEVIENERKRDYYWYGAKVGRVLVNRSKEFGKPDLVVVEQGSESSQGTGIAGIIWIWNCLGAINSIFGAYGIPVATITPDAWRKPFFGRDFQPPRNPVLDDNGNQLRDKFGRLKWKNDWKAAIVTKCEEEGVTLPRRKAIAHNAGEALGIAHSWAHASIINPSFEANFKAMLQGRNERGAAA